MTTFDNNLYTAPEIFKPGFEFLQKTQQDVDKLCAAMPEKIQRERAALLNLRNWLELSMCTQSIFVYLGEISLNIRQEVYYYRRYQKPLIIGCFLHNHHSNHCRH